MERTTMKMNYRHACMAAFKESKKMFKYNDTEKKIKL